VATTEEVAELRRMIAEPSETTYTDLALSALIDASNLYQAAVSIWSQKASAYAGLVDITESGSSRKLSDLQKNALAMASFYKAQIAAEVETTTDVPPRTVAIERP
jgi:hypothetical protein